MWRHSENSSDFIDLELARFEELRLFRRDGDRRVLESFLQHGNFVAISTATEGGLPAFPYALRVLNRAGMFENAAWCRTIGKKLSAIFLGGDCQAHSVFCHRYR